MKLAVASFVGFFAGTVSALTFAHYQLRWTGSNLSGGQILMVLCGLLVVGFVIGRVWPREEGGH